MVCGRDLGVDPLAGNRDDMGVPQVSDIVDNAEAVEELELAINLAKARRPSMPMISCGSCHNFDAITPDGALFCDADCRDDYQRRATLPPRQ